MAASTLDIPTPPTDGEILFHANLEAAYVAIEAWATDTVDNLNQLALDVGGSSYTLDNDGAANFGTNLQTQITNIITGVTPITALQLNDTSADHQYVFGVSELIADRTVTLPLLISDDTFVFEDHIQTLTNKTLTSPTIDIIDAVIIGTKTPGWANNIGIATATTATAGDSIKITSADGTAFSAANPGKVSIASTTSGQLTEFTITADVTIDLTGAHWGNGTEGDLADAILHVLALNNDGAISWGVSFQAGRDIILDTLDSATATDINLPEEVLVSSALTADAQALEVARFHANFDDTGGASEDIWVVQTGDGDLNMGSGLSGVAPPVGTIIAHYDFSGRLKIDTNFWVYCDGTAGVTVGGIGSQTLPDLSNRYMVGFGTEGGGDVDTAAWATAAVGNASHQVNIQHSHTVDGHTHTIAHTHTLSAHTHTSAAHTHALSSAAWARIAAVGGGSGDIIMDVVTGLGSWTSDRRCDSTDQAAGETITEGAILDGVTDSTTPGVTGVPSSDVTGASSAANSGSTGPGTDSQLSTTQSIQPRSLRVRYIMRIR